MTQPRVKWQRFWRRIEGNPVDLGDDGFLVDPESEYGRYFSRIVQPVDLLSSKPCVVVLGEPGSGKSTLLSAEIEAIRSHRDDSDQEPIYLDLHTIGTDTQLSRSLFESREFIEWKESERDVTLVLDSFDECRLQIDTLHHIFSAELKRCPTERLRLRVACRSGDWPYEFEKELKKIWGKEHVDVNELAPLRRKDVMQAADERGIDSTAFLESVHIAGAVPLAVKPLTLMFLLQVFERDGALPTKQTDLYDECCLRLCAESDQRRENRVPRQLEDQQRLAVAKRIAACTVFANREAISLSGTVEDALEDDLLVAQLSGGTELVKSDAFPITESGVRETLNTGVFSSSGPRRLGWVHRTYAEFLAARYVVDHGLALPQILSLITLPGDPDNKVIPQLHETAAWIAGMRPEVFHEILVHDPGVLLSSDLASFTDEERAMLVSALFAAGEAGEWVDRGWSHQRYAGFKHPKLTEQLRPYITDRGYEHMVRKVAIEIAEACRELDLLEDLVCIALDQVETVDSRISAAYAVNRIGDDGARHRLRSLVDTPENIDPSAQLKGCGLRATWPGLLTTEDFLGALTPPQTNFLGAYQSFLYDDPMQHVPAQDLPLALKWAEEHARSISGFNHHLSDLVESVLQRACQHLDIPVVRSTLGNLVLTLARKSDFPFAGGPPYLLKDDGLRRQLLVATVDSARDEKDIRLLVLTGIVTSADATWLLKRHQGRSDPTDERWARLLRDVLLYEDRQAIEAVLEARETDPFLAAIIEPRFHVFELDSKEAQEQRSLHQMCGELQRRDAERTSAADPHTESIIAPLLKKVADGELAAWWQINHELAINEFGLHIGDFQSDLTHLSRWQDLSSATQTMLAAAADQYVREAIPAPDQWIKAEKAFTIYQPDWTGFRALHLLLTQSPDQLAALPDDVWKRWAQVIVAYPTFEREAQHQELVDRAYEHAPENVLATLDILINGQQLRESPSAEGIMWKVDQCWDGRLTSFVLDKAGAPATSTSIMESLLEKLFEHDVEAASSFAISLLLFPSPTDTDNRERVSISAALLLNHAANLGWPTVWPLIRDDDAFLTSVVARLVWDDHHDELVTAKLESEQIADLYIRLARMYPHAEDPETNGDVGFRASVGFWRDDLLSALQHRGTSDSCLAIERIAMELPHLQWLKRSLLSAKDAARRHAWLPPKLEDILALAQSADMRLVQSNEQLLDVIVESLKRLEDKLQRAEPPRAISLWDQQAGARQYRPKDEERLSDHIKSHLEDDLRDRGIVSNREVVNRRGLETDIRVEAIQIDENAQIANLWTVVIEVKGCWNGQLASAMKSQLVERYLANNNARHGLYVVGWYNCDKWDDTDWRKNRSPRYDKAEAQQRLDLQATELSKDGTLVRAVVLDTALRY